ncbi:MAG: rhomboid family intramembrane serine protease [Planctomycetes bacterium]|nr:rhomboid family intramembrane serine protease [Planctomycetota bacterium]
MKHDASAIDGIPVTMLVAIAYVTLAFVTDPFSPPPQKLETWGWVTPMLVADGEPWRLLTAAFLHGGIVHLLLNLSALLAIGPALERSIGSLRYAALYVVAAIGGNVAVCFVNHPLSPVVGGSGALFGMLGGLVALNMRSGRHLFSFLDFEGPRRLLSTIAVNLAIGFLLPFISNTAHVGGLVSGFLVTFLFLVPPRRPVDSLRHWRAAVAALFASCVFWSIVPATRWDRCWYEGEATKDPVRRAALLRAAAMAASGAAAADDGDIEAMRHEVIEPIEQQLEEAGRRVPGRR